MKIAHTLFDDRGKPLGQAVQDAQTRAVRFTPQGADQPLPTIWLSVEACRRSVLRLTNDFNPHTEN